MFVPEARINIIPAFVQLMAGGRQDDKPLSESVMARPKWDNALMAELHGRHFADDIFSAYP